MLFLRVQSVFLSLVLSVGLFLISFNLMGLTWNETSEEIFGYSLLFCTILIMPSFYGIFIILSSILLLDICEVVKKHFCGFNDIFFYNYYCAILLGFLLVRYAQCDTFVNSNGFSTLSLYLFGNKRLENFDSCI